MKYGQKKWSATGKSLSVNHFNREIGALVRYIVGSGRAQDGDDTQQMSDLEKRKLKAKEKFCKEFNRLIRSKGIAIDILEIDETTGKLVPVKELKKMLSSMYRQLQEQEGKQDMGAGNESRHASLDDFYPKGRSMTEARSLDTKPISGLAAFIRAVDGINNAIDSECENPSQASSTETKVLIVTLSVSAMLALSSLCAICAAYATISPILTASMGIALSLSGGAMGGSLTALAIILIADRDEVPLPENVKRNLGNAQEDLEQATIALQEKINNARYPIYL